MKEIIKENLIVDKQQLINLLLSNTNVLTLLNNNTITNEQLNDNPYIVKDYIDSINKCNNCQDLNDCKQRLQGHYLSINNDYELLYTPCKYKINNITKYNQYDKYLINYIGSKYKDCKFDNINFDNEDLTYKYLVKDIKARIDDSNTKGLFLYGSFGVGKTYLGTCITNEYALKGNTVCFIYLPDWIIDMKKYLLNNNNKYNEQLNYIRQSNIVVFDDIGVENLTIWSRDELLMPILNYRLDNNLKTWFTSNENQENLLKRYITINNDIIKGNRLIERIINLSDERIVKGKDRRKS